MLLAGDLGGTKTALALFDPEDLQTPLNLQQFVSNEFGGLEQIVTRYMEQHPCEITASCFGVAGPVTDGVCETINLPWTVRESTLAELIASGKSLLINDLEATAWSLKWLKPEDLKTIDPGRDIPGNRAVIAAGTGLGEAGVWYGRHYHPFASEGGHADFSPQTYEEDALLSFLRNKYRHVSWERVLSGPGIENIYEFLVNTYRARPAAAIAERMQAGLNAAVITSAAMRNECPACVHTMKLFVSLYGAEAGNLALKLMSIGGVYIGGGIAPKILPLLDSDDFRTAFIHKGRLSSVLEDVPVNVILTPLAPLYGSAYVAKLLSEDQPIY